MPALSFFLSLSHLFASASDQTKQESTQTRNQIAKSPKKAKKNKKRSPLNDICRIDTIRRRNSRIYRPDKCSAHRVKVFEFQLYSNSELFLVPLVFELNCDFFPCTSTLWLLCFKFSQWLSPSGSPAWRPSFCASSLLNVSFTSRFYFAISARWVPFLFVSFSANCRANWSCCLTLMGPVQAAGSDQGSRSRRSGPGIWSFGHLAIWPHCIKVCFVLINYNLCGCKTYKRAHHKMIARPVANRGRERGRERKGGETDATVVKSELSLYSAYSRSISLKATTLGQGQ